MSYSAGMHNLTDDLIWCTGVIILTGKNKGPRKKNTLVPLYPPRTPGRLTWSWTQASAVIICRRLSQLPHGSMLLLKQTDMHWLHPSERVSI